MFIKLYNYFEKIYKDNICQRADENGAIFYYGEKDFSGLHKREYPFVSSFGHKLAGYIYFRDNYIKDRIVIFDHGMGSGHRGYMKEINLLTLHGFMVFAYDHTGCMESEGETTGGFCQSLADLDDAICAIKSDEELKECDISAMGHSWGAFSTANILAYHPNISHVVSISAFVSFSNMLSQFFVGPLKKVAKRIYNEEKQKFPKYVDANAIKALKNTSAKVLLIHSTDDNAVSYKKNFASMQNALGGRENIRFLAVTGKRHNPNYTEDAVKYKDEFFATYKKKMKKGELDTPEKRKIFKEGFDWERMTSQDMSVWEEIFKTLDK